MAYFGQQFVDGTKTAGANYSSANQQYKVVKSTAAGTFTVQASAGGVIMGVMQNLPASGQAGAIAVGGITKVRQSSAASVAIWTKLVASTGGGVKPWTTASQYVIGRSLDASTAAGIITMQITHQGAGSTEAAAAG